MVLPAVVVFSVSEIFIVYLLVGRGDWMEEAVEFDAG